MYGLPCFSSLCSVLPGAFLLIFASFCPLSSAGLKSALKVKSTPVKRQRPDTPKEDPKGQSEDGSELSEAELLPQEGSAFAQVMEAGPEFEAEKLLKIVTKMEGRYGELLQVVNGRMPAALAKEFNRFARGMEEDLEGLRAVV